MDDLSFGHPGRLWLLLAVVALAVAYVLLQRRRRTDAVPLPGLELLAMALPKLGWRRHVPAAAMLIAMVAATTAFATPTATVKVPRERATIVVALDVSLSMAAQDVDPDRITAAKEAAANFVEGLPDRFNVGLVAFSGTASIAVPPTQDHETVSRTISTLELGNGTAIGDAVATSVEALAAVPGSESGENVPARIVLLSDGANTSGSPVSVGVELATAAGVPVSTIAYGTPDGTVRVPDGFLRVPVDAPALAELAQQTGGQAYEAESGDELQGVYEDIGSQVGSIEQRRPVAAGATGLALLAAVVAGAAALAWSPRSV